MTIDHVCVSAAGGARRLRRAPLESATLVRCSYLPKRRHCHLVGRRHLAISSTNSDRPDRLGRPVRLFQHFEDLVEGVMDVAAVQEIDRESTVEVGLRNGAAVGE